MVTEVSLAVIAITLVILVIIAVIALIKMKNAVERMQADLHEFSLQTISFMSKLDEITADFKKRSQLTSFLPKPLSFLAGESENDASLPNQTMPQVVEWVANSLILIKKLKGFIKNHAR